MVISSTICFHRTIPFLKQKYQLKRDQTFSCHNRQVSNTTLLLSQLKAVWTVLNLYLIETGYSYCKYNKGFEVWPEITVCKPLSMLPYSWLTIYLRCHSNVSWCHSNVLRCHNIQLRCHRHLLLMQTTSTFKHFVVQ